MMDLTYSAAEDDVRRLVAQALNMLPGYEERAAAGEAGRPYDERLWSVLHREIGVLPSSAESLPVRSWRETSVVAEELGRTVAGTPLLGSALAAAAMQALSGNDFAWASEGSTVCLAIPAGFGPAAPFPQTVVAHDGRLAGELANVADVELADTLVVPAVNVGVPALYAVEAAAVRRIPVCSFDLTRPLSDVSFDRVAATLVAEGTEAETALRHAVRTGTALLASEQVGLAQQCLDFTVAHLKTRYQFGQPLGAFQALKHRVAAVWANIAKGRAAARYAIGCVADATEDLEVAASVAHAFCSELATTAAEECLQLHGGLGFTWNHPVHLYLKRAEATRLTFGTPAAHRAHLARLVGLPG